MPIHFINPEALPTPNGYSQIATTDAKQFIYIAGQVALNSQGELVGKDDFLAQTKQVYENLKRALDVVGARFENVIKTTTYVVDTNAEKLHIVGLMRAHYQGTHLPANTYIGVEGLALSELLIEIEAIAVID